MTKKTKKPTDKMFKKVEFFNTFQTHNLLISIAPVAFVPHRWT